MRIRNFVCIAACLALMVNTTYGQLLYDQDFDTNDTANWTVATGNPTDDFSDFLHDSVAEDMLKKIKRTGLEVICHDVLADPSLLDDREFDP